MSSQEHVRRVHGPRSGEQRVVHRRDAPPPRLPEAGPRMSQNAPRVQEQGLRRADLHDGRALSTRSNRITPVPTASAAWPPWRRGRRPRAHGRSSCSSTFGTARPRRHWTPVIPTPMVKEKLPRRRYALMNSLDHDGPASRSAENDTGCTTLTWCVMPRLLCSPPRKKANRRRSPDTGRRLQQRRGDPGRPRRQGEVAAAGPSRRARVDYQECEPWLRRWSSIAISTRAEPCVVRPARRGDGQEPRLNLPGRRESTEKSSRPLTARWAGGPFCHRLRTQGRRTARGSPRSCSVVSGRARRPIAPPSTLVDTVSPPSQVPKPDHGPFFDTRW